MRRRSRLKDIADQTGFSTNTVSLALHHSPLVAEETSKAIWAAARQLKYRPNQLARSLVSRQSKTIGLILTNIQNPILTRAAQAIHGVLSEHRYATLFATSNHSIDEEKNALEVFFSRQVDGILIYPTNPAERTHIAEIIGNGTPVVMLSGLRQTDVETVSFDARAGARQAIEHLIGLGHRRIGFIDNSAALGNPEKEEGYLMALAAAKLPQDRNLMIDPQGFDASHGYDAIGKADGPQAPAHRYSRRQRHARLGRYPLGREPFRPYPGRSLHRRLRQYRARGAFGAAAHYRQLCRRRAFPPRCRAATCPDRTRSGRMGRAARGVG